MLSYGELDTMRDGLRVITRASLWLVRPLSVGFCPKLLRLGDNVPSRR